MKSVNVKKNNFDFYKECPVCAAKNIKDKYQVKGYKIAECLECQALFVQEIVTDAFLNKFYKQLKGDFVYEENNRKFLNRYYYKIKMEIEKIKPDKGSILDIGCSSGFFLDQMEGWEKHGIEMSEKFGRTARDKIGDTVYIGSFENYPVKNNYFDVITLQDVFDHFIDPYKNLKKCYDMLKPNGLILIKVHNTSCLYAKLTGANFYPIIPPAHLFYFNEKSLKTILNRADFNFLKSKFIGHVLQLKTIFFRLSRDGTNPFFYALCKLVRNNILGKIAFYKNFHDIITVFAIKEGEEEKV